MAEVQRTVYDDVDDALRDVIRKQETSMVTRWVVLVETIDEEGARGLWQLASSQNMQWDTKGMLQQAMDWEAAKTMRDMLNLDKREDDD